MTTNGEADELVVAELAAVLDEVGVQFELRLPAGPDQAGDLILAGGVAVEVKRASRPTISQLERLGIHQEPSSAGATVLVADQLDPGARRALKDAGWGWLDRSGHLRLLAGPVQIDRPIEGLAGPDPTPPTPLARPTGLAVALELLDSDGARRSIRNVASSANVSVGAAHAAVSELADQGLVEDMRPRTRDLFWAVADHWHLRWFGLASGPLPGIPGSTRRLLRMRLDECDLSLPGWAEVGDVAAQVYGARVTSDGPPRLYLPDGRALTWALRTWGETQDDRSATAFLAVAPTGNAVADRRDPLRDDGLLLANPASGEWPLARPLVVALNLASDSSPRSRDVLETWDPTEAGLDRVW